MRDYTRKNSMIECVGENLVLRTTTEEGQNVGETVGRITGIHGERLFDLVVPDDKITVIRLPLAKTTYLGHHRHLSLKNTAEEECTTPPANETITDTFLWR